MLNRRVTNVSLPVFELKSVFKALEVINNQKYFFGKCFFLSKCLNNNQIKIIRALMRFSRQAGSKHILVDLDTSISKFDLKLSRVKVTWWLR